MLLQKSLLLFFSTICMITSCNKATPPTSSSWQLVAGRDNGESLERPLLYRALAPSHWIRQDTPPSESIVDTTKSICEFYIHDKGESIRVTIHTFPILPEKCFCSSC